jgi:signal transduction histidine kinase
VPAGTPLYSAALGLALLSAVLGWLLARRRAARRPGPARKRQAVGGSPARRPGGGDPRRPRLPTVAERAPAPEPAAVAPGAPGLLDLARRNRDLLDQQLELLGQARPGRGDPELRGKLLQLGRLAGRARRNAHSLVVLAGGEPGDRAADPVPLADVVKAAVRDSRDAGRVRVQVGDDLRLAGAAADLTRLIAELVENAVAFSAPETRVRVSGQMIGSGYVLEIEDRGLGMTDAELDEVNARLAGRAATGGEQLGVWVAGRLAARHDVKVQLRRRGHGGMTALVILPEELVVRPDGGHGPGAPARASRAKPTGSASEGAVAAAAHFPLRRYMTHLPVPRRPDDGQAHARAPAGEEPRQATRSPEEVRSLLSEYRSGLERGRAAARDRPPEPG